MICDRNFPTNGCKFILPNGLLKPTFEVNSSTNMTLEYILFYPVIYLIARRPFYLGYREYEDPHDVCFFL